MKIDHPQSSPNIYERLDPLSCAGSPLNETKTTAAISSLMVQQKREIKKKTLPKLTPISEPDVNLNDELCQSPCEPAAYSDRSRSSKVVGTLIFKAVSLCSKKWFVPLLCVLIFPELVITAVLITVILALLFMTFVGPEPLFGLISRDWRRYTTTKMTSKQDALTLAGAIASFLIEAKRRLMLFSRATGR